MILDEIEKIRQLDKSNLLGSIELLPKQCQQTWEEIKKLPIPQNYKDANKIVVNGMGGSGLGPHIAKSVFSDELKIPLEVINDYSLPEYVNEKTLVILSSYSGTTEEVLESFNKVLKRQSLCLGITTGGRLEEVLKKNNFPYFKINPVYNPCNQPRMGLGYSILGTIGLLSQCGLIKVNDQEISDIISTLDKTNSLFGVSIPTHNNFAKQIAKEFFGKITILVAAEFLAGSIHSWRNQQHEVGKNFGTYFLLPELNHHLLEGLTFPQINKGNLVSFFLKSNLYHPSVQKRVKITKKVFENIRIPPWEYNCFSKTKLVQAFEVIHFGGYVNFYLAMLNNIDPSPIPIVDFFKRELAKE